MQLSHAEESGDTVGLCVCLFLVSTTTAWKGNNRSWKHKTESMLDKNRSGEHLGEHLNDGPEIVLTTKQQVVEEFAICRTWENSACDEVEQVPDSHVWCEPCCRTFKWQVGHVARMGSRICIHNPLVADHPSVS
jgi:hypothetical protein